MQPKAILDAAAETYSKLQSLAVDILTIQESDDDGGSNRSEQRYRAYFVAPARIRLEHASKNGSLTVSDGTDLHHFFKRPKHYRKQALLSRNMLPGFFQPEFPGMSAPAFLFNRIAENVVRADFVSEEAACHVVKVKYGDDRPPGAPLDFSPVTFWVDKHTHLILRSAGEMTHRIPPDQEETRTSRHTLVFGNYRVDEAIPPETFQFTPPEGVDDAEPGVGWAGGNVGGWIGSLSSGGGSADRRRVESWHGHEWSGETLVERAKLKFRGIDLEFERRLTLSKDGKQLSIVERITGPKGDSERETSIPVE